MVVSHDCSFRGLIPARAGKTPRAGPPASAPPAHPRACGENDFDRLAEAAGNGSSPRVRGKHREQVRQRRRRRLIPARAGKTMGCFSFGGTVGAHPRACGENDIAGCSPPALQGSSPRVRGKPHRRPARGPAHRLIPARAGKTARWRSRSCWWGAHPRACGENAPLHLKPSEIQGSSPRVRGKLAVLGGEAEERGLIPARAGKTTPPPPASWGPAAHPRACGENSSSSGLLPRGPGSSPRVRGKPSRWP
ncbi:hypothetical protein HMPREF1550_00919 [Actinomyces sp. oral taxon 877 str. F0543]|nr:hypothetical protein HMPREF1550_00919 [Actinomyces sp. oral taxon 877 str. F0543]